MTAKAAIAIALTTLAALAGSPTAGGAPQAQQAVRVVLEGRIEGPAAPFLVALDRGFYKSEGLSVTIEPGNGADDVLARLASGAFEIGFADINALITYRDAHPGAAVTAVFMVYNKPPFAIIGRRSRGVSFPRDLEGKRLGAPKQARAFVYWPIFAEANGIDVTKVRIEPIGVPVREPMLAAGEVDAIAGESFSSQVNLKDRGVPAEDISVLLFADHGVRLYGGAILVNAKFASEKPDAVRAFLRAYLRGLKETVRRPAVAIDSVLTRDGSARRDIELERLQLALRANILTAEVKANGYGGVDAARLAEAIEQVALIHAYKNPRPRAEHLFDASFLPDAAQRRAK